jgi:hypothetical protein
MKKNVGASLATLKKQLVRLKKNHYDAALLTYDKEFSSYQEGALEVAPYVLYLNSVITAETPVLNDFISAALIEGSIDFARVEQERGAMLTATLHRLSSEDMNALVKLSEQVKAGTLKQSGYYARLRSLAVDHGIELKTYPEFTLYMDYLSKSEAIDNVALFDEIDALERRVETKLAATPEQKEIVALTKAYYLMQKIVEKRLTDKEWSRYKKDAGNWESRVPEIPAFKEFYEVASQRSETMAEKMAERMRETGAPTGVIVAGGFHSAEIVSALKKKTSTSFSSHQK